MFRKLDAWINRARKQSTKFFNFSHRFLPIFYWIKSAWFWVSVLFIVVYAASGWVTFKHWEWFKSHESDSAAIRNFALTLVAAVGLPLAIWRSWVAERQVKTAQRGLLNERYQKGSEMLGSNVLTVRLGGIYALERLAAEQPKEYHVQVIKLLCSFVRDEVPVKRKTTVLDDGSRQGDRSKSQVAEYRLDIDAVLEAIGSRSQVQKDLEDKIKYVPSLDYTDLRRQHFWNKDLSGLRLMHVNLSTAFLVFTKFSGARFYGADLSKAGLTRADLSGASLEKADLSSANLSGADCSDSNLKNADLKNACLRNADLKNTKLYEAIFDEADLTNANLSGAKFSLGDALAKGLTQKQIDSAVAEPVDNPPAIEGVIDAETGKPIVWKK